jgi:hypothetical protein
MQIVTVWLLGHILFLPCNYHQGTWDQSHDFHFSVTLTWLVPFGLLLLEKLIQKMSNSPMWHKLHMILIDWMVYLATPSTISVTKFMHLQQVTMNAIRTLKCFNRTVTSNFSKHWRLNLMIMRLVIIGHSYYKKTCLQKPKWSWLFGISNVNVILMACLTNTRCGARVGGALDYIPNSTLRLIKRRVFTLTVRFWVLRT